MSELVAKEPKKAENFAELQAWYKAKQVKQADKAKQLPFGGNLEAESAARAHSFTAKLASAKHAVSRGSALTGVYGNAPLVFMELLVSAASAGAAAASAVAASAASAAR